MGSDHFYTTSESERDGAVANSGYHIEEIAAYVFDGPIAGSVPFYRLFGPSGDHFYTTSAEERDNAVKNAHYKAEGIACYVLPNSTTGSVPLYRLWNSSTGDHFYTISTPERDQAVAVGGYKSEGLAGYVFSGPGDNTVAFWRLWNEPAPVSKATDFEIDSITYNVDHAQILKSDVDTIYTLKTSNATTVSQTSELDGSQSVTDTSGWSDTIGLKIGAKATLQVGVPIVANGTVQVSAEVDTTFTWNGSESVAKTWSWRQPVTIPPNSTVLVTVTVVQSTLKVPYTLYGRFVFTGGAKVGGLILGTYTGLNSHDLSVNIITAANGRSTVSAEVPKLSISPSAPDVPVPELHIRSVTLPKESES